MKMHQLKNGILVHDYTESNLGYVVTTPADFSYVSMGYSSSQGFYISTTGTWLNTLDEAEQFQCELNMMIEAKIEIEMLLSVAI
jgi:hypothetical protein